jgi:hypothetical protein
MMEVTLLLFVIQMLNVLSAFPTALSLLFRTQIALQMEILALRHQIGVPTLREKTIEVDCRQTGSCGLGSRESGVTGGALW